MISAHNTDYSFNFYNDRVKEAIAADIMAEPFTYIPIKAGHMELLSGEDGDALVFGKITEGQDIIDISVSHDLTYRDVGSEYPRVAMSFYPLETERTIVSLGGGRSRLTVKAVLVLVIPEDIYENANYLVSILNKVTGSTLSGNYLASPGDVLADVKSGLEASLVAGGIDVVAGSPANQIYMFEKTAVYEGLFFIVTPYTVMLNYSWEAYIYTEGLASNYNSLKNGAVHAFGIVYKDGSGRVCSAIKSQDWNIYIPFYTESSGMDINEIVELVLKVHNAPPDYAETYEIVYYGNISMDYYLQLREDTIIDMSVHGMPDYFAANIQRTLDDTRGKNSRWKVANYDWQEGDRIRLIGYISDLGIFFKYDALYDYEITQLGDEYGDVADAGEFLYFQASDHPDGFGNDSSIANATGNLNGTVAHTTLNASAAKRVDKITLTGSSGTANVTVGMLTKLATWNASGLNQTATDFVTANAALYLAIGIVLTADGADLVFTASADGVDFPGNSNIVVEIYRPRKGIAITTPYGSGMVFGIGTDSDGNRYHMGDVDQVFDADGALIVPAEVNCLAHDGYKYTRLNYAHGTETIRAFWAESVCPSDWWNYVEANKLTSNGFPFLDDLNQKQTVLDERIRNGGFIITGSRTNNLAHFVYDDYLDLPKKNGAITGLRMVGYTLKVLQMYKETSIYINRVVNFNADGTENFTLTNQFLGTVYPMATDFGCQSPGSVMVNDRNLYYWDDSMSAFIRSAPNGQINLASSQYKVSRWFKDVASWLRLNNGSSVGEIHIGANNEHEEVWITFRIGTTVNGMIFSEKDGRFKSRIDQPTEGYVHLGTFFAHMYKQKLWIMNLDGGQGYLRWSDSPVYAKYKIASNIDIEKNKLFKSVALYSDYPWTSESKSITIPDVASAVNEKMESNIALWDRKEGIYYGSILKDENSRGSFSSVNDRKMNGRSLRGRYCLLEFKTEEHLGKVRLDKIVVFSTESERNP